MRRNIYEVLKSGNVDIQKEYSRIYDLFYEVSYDGYYSQSVTLEDIVTECFNMLNTNLIGRCLSLDDFNESYNYRFDPQPKDFSIETLIELSEYVENFVRALMMAAMNARLDIQTLHKVEMHIESCMEDVGYKKVERDGIIIFVENNQAAISASEIIEPELAYSVLEYNHYKLKGNLARKKDILKNLADSIEPERSALKSINSNFTSDLFQLFNKFIRHDNSDNNYISSMSDSEIEDVYDDIYQMWLLAKLQLEQADRNDKVRELIKKING
ncbi:hypothetical protein [Butyrivibrio fibrisolvens]|uniref:hypothetical protein n=1 Tax=Butyrivibrio fibrisolvens TaxID=831 RepID=UPI0003B46D9A|nr:hypothetical protein [Butyrivibrio fibrisolvens]